MRPCSFGFTSKGHLTKSSAEANQELFIFRKDPGRKFKIARYSFSTIYDGESQDFMRMPFQELLDQIGSGELRVQIGKVFHLDQIVEAHRTMEENKAGGKMVVLT